MRLGFFFSSIILAATEGEEPLKEDGVCTNAGMLPSKVVLCIDESSSVKEEAFKNQIELANEVLRVIREMYREKNGGLEGFHFGFLTFSGQSSITVRIPLTADDGEKTISVDENERKDSTGTDYAAALGKAKEVLDQGPNGSMPLIWLLTDGEPVVHAGGIKTKEQFKEFRAENLVDVTTIAVLLSPKQDIGPAQEILQTLTCRDPDSACTNTTIIGKIGDIDFADFKAKSNQLISNVFAKLAFNPICIAVPIIVLAIVGGCVLLLCCCYGGKLAVAKFMEEEEGPMTQQGGNGNGEPAVRKLGQRNPPPDLPHLRNRRERHNAPDSPDASPQYTRRRKSRPESPLDSPRRKTIGLDSPKRAALADLEKRTTGAVKKKTKKTIGIVGKLDQIGLEP